MSNKNVLIETTLSGKSVSNLIKQAQKQGEYLITLLFIFLDNEALCIERVKTRVSKGGHPVPEKYIVRRFGRSFSSFVFITFDGLLIIIQRTTTD